MAAKFERKVPVKFVKKTPTQTIDIGAAEAGGPSYDYKNDRQLRGLTSEVTTTSIKYLQTVTVTALTKGANGEDCVLECNIWNHLSRVYMFNPKQETPGALRMVAQFELGGMGTTYAERREYARWLKTAAPEMLGMLESLLEEENC